MRLNLYSCKNCASVIDLDIVEDLIGDTDKYYVPCIYGGYKLDEETTIFDNNTCNFHPKVDCPSCGEGFPFLKWSL